LQGRRNALIDFLCFPTSIDGLNCPRSLDMCMCSGSCHIHGYGHHFPSYSPPPAWVFQRHWHTHISRRTLPLPLPPLARPSSSSPVSAEIILRN
jgi:hypothetical protein